MSSLSQLPTFVHVILWLFGLLLLALPILASVCFVLSTQARSRGDEGWQLAWLRASISFAGMTFTSWALLFAAWLVFRSLQQHVPLGPTG
ncbi:MAG TPA: hypothetical protein DCZ72_04815 [Armatimonadetes bacterium]|nr:hypothetical protein [Armatimonadota bacterium]